MARNRALSRQSIAVLEALVGDEWLHGYELAKSTGLKSGTLYPLLIRLADRGLLVARWEDEQPAGRPRRHLYRITDTGAAALRTAPVISLRPATGAA